MNKLEMLSVALSMLAIAWFVSRIEDQDLVSFFLLLLFILPHSPFFQFRDVFTCPCLCYGDYKTLFTTEPQSITITPFPAHLFVVLGANKLLFFVCFVFHTFIFAICQCLLSRHPESFF